MIKKKIQSTRRNLMLAVSLAAVSWAVPTTGMAQEYPANPITFVVPFSAGSATDQLARAVAQGVPQASGVSAVVENKPGASAMTGATAAAREPPDVYPVLITA